eukprot:scaffold14530_cov69-Phaeocystis_antarctica.AAC.4
MRWRGRYELGATAQLLSTPTGPQPMSGACRRRPERVAHVASASERHTVCEWSPHGVHETRGRGRVGGTLVRAEAEASPPAGEAGLTAAACRGGAESPAASADPPSNLQAASVPKAFGPWGRSTA